MLRMFRALGAAVMIAFLSCAAGGAQEPPCEAPHSETLKQIGELLAERRLDEARRALERLRAEVAELDCQRIELRMALAEGQILLDEGRLTEADALVRALEIPETAPPELEADRLYIEGSVAYELGQPRWARAIYRQMLELDQREGSSAGPRLVASDHYLIALTFVDEAAGVADQAAVAQHFRDALADADAVGGAQLVPSLYIVLGKLVGGEEGLAYLEQGRELASLAEDRATALGALAVEHLADDPVAAKHLLDQALEVAEAALQEEGNPWPLLNLWADRLTVRWATLPRDEAIAETQAMLEHIETIRREQGEAVVRASFFSVWAEVYQWFAGRLLADAGESPGRSELAQVFEVSERYRARVLAESLTAAGTEVEDSEHFADLDTIARHLGEDEALLSFQIAPEHDVFGRFAGGSWLMVVTRDSVRSYPLPERGLLEPRVRTYLGLVIDRKDEREAAVRLYQDLLHPALADLPEPIDKLILVPDGDLHLLPFGALRSVPEGYPLAHRFQIARVPSASLWLRWRTAGEPEGARAEAVNALVLANPLPGGVPRSALRDALGPLPFAEDEGRAVVESLGKGSLLRLGHEASEAFFVEQTGRSYGLIHLAAHGVVDDVHPELSAVLLAEGDGHDGELRAAEIAELELEGAIVVLSACHSASGGVLRGEGVMSLARAFFQAGATTVVGSLWPLDDREAKILFAAFYRHLERGASVQGALHGAQRELRDAGAPTATWSGVVVLGDGARVPRPNNPWMSLVGWVLFFVFLWLAARTAFRRR